MGGGDGDRVEDGVDSDVGEAALLVEGDAEAFEVFEELGVGVVEAVELWLLLGGGVVGDGLEVDGRVEIVGPGGWGHGEEPAVGVEAEAEHPIGFLFDFGDGFDGGFGEAFGDGEGVDVGPQPVLVLALEKLLDWI